MANPEREGRTEKPTGKRLSKARSEGQVARSQEINGAAILLVSLAVLAIDGHRLLHQLESIVQDGLSRTGSPQLVAGGAGLHGLYTWGARAFLVAVAPIVGTIALTGVLASVAQVRLRFTTKQLMPGFSKLNPASGLKRMFGPRQTVELGKSVAKLLVIGGAGTSAIWGNTSGLGTLVGLPPELLLGHIGSLVLSIAFRIGGALVVIAALDYVWQKRQLMRSLMMSKDEVKREAREADVAPEVRGHIRKKQIEAARRRMLADVPTADVVVVNPTHYAVALRYDGSKPAPEVVAKGVDHLAHTIREIAEEAGVTIVSAPPLARALYRNVELGQLVPEEFFQAVAEVLAFVFRTAGRRRRPSSISVTAGR